MKRRLREVIGLLEFEELAKIKDDLNKGGDAIRILVDNRMREEIKKMNQFCAVCSSRIEPESSTRFSLEVGPEEMKRKVSFCAIDCLGYFINEIKKLKKEQA